MSQQTSQRQGRGGQRGADQGRGGNAGPIKRTYQAKVSQTQTGPKPQATASGVQQGGTPQPSVQSVVKPVVQPVVQKGPPPKRKITITTALKEIEYGTPITIAGLGATATGAGGDLRLETPLGELQVGQSGPNLRIVAPGDGVNWSDGEELLTVTVKAAPRTISSRPPTAPVLIGTPLTPEMFDARPSAGGGTVVVSEPAAKLASPAGKLHVVLTLAPDGNYAAAPPAPHDIDVILPKRVITWTPPATLEYGKSLSIKDVGGSATGEGGDLRLEFPLGPFDTSQKGNNLKIIAPGKDGAWEGDEKSAAVAITPAPRDLTFQPPKRPLKTGAVVTAATFGAQDTAGGVTPVVTVPKDGKLLEIGQAVDVELHLPAGNHVEVTKQFKVKVEKGVPKLTLTSSVASVARNTQVDASWLTAAIQPEELKTKIILTPAIGVALTKVDQVFISAEFPGDDHFLKAGPVEVRLSVCQTAAEGAGADAMNDDAEARGSIRQYYKDDPATAKLLQDWDNDAGGMKTNAQKIMSDIQCMTSEQLVKYMDKETKSRTPGKPGEDQLWKLKNGLQVRYKANGDKFNPRKHFCIEVAKVADSRGPQDIAFKVTLGGVPGPVGNDVFVPQDVMDLGAGAKGDFINGVISMTHPRVLAKRQQPIQWALADATDVYINEDIDATVWTASAVNAVTYKIGRSVKEFKKGEKIVMPAENNVVIKAFAEADDKYDLGVAERRINLKRR